MSAWLVFRENKKVANLQKISLDSMAFFGRLFIIVSNFKRKIVTVPPEHV